MCMINYPISKVSKTNLLIARLKSKQSNRDYQFVSYGNSIELDKSQKNNAMILPIPCSVQDIIVIDSKETWSESLIKTMKKAFDRLTVTRGNTFGFGDSYSLQSKSVQTLEVFQAGSYKYSIAPSLDQLNNFNSMVFSFELSNELKEYLQLYYKDGPFSYLILQLDKSADYHPFCYLHPIAFNRMFIPTRHFHAHGGAAPLSTPSWAGGQFNSGIPLNALNRTPEFLAAENSWRGRTRSGMSLAAICNTCGGSSISTCDCAKARFMHQNRSSSNMPFTAAPFDLGPLPPAYFTDIPIVNNNTVQFGTNINNGNIPEFTFGFPTPTPINNGGWKGHSPSNEFTHDWDHDIYVFNATDDIEDPFQLLTTSKDTESFSPIKTKYPVYHNKSNQDLVNSWSTQICQKLNSLQDRDVFIMKSYNSVIRLEMHGYNKNGDILVDVSEGKDIILEHKGVNCDLCGQKDIKHTRWCCITCSDYDLCNTCHSEQIEHRPSTICFKPEVNPLTPNSHCRETCILIEINTLAQQRQINKLRKLYR